MPVQREEFLAAAGFMTQDDERSIVQRSGTIRYDVDHAIQRRKQRRALFHKKIDPQMDCAALVGRIAGGPKQRRTVKQSRLTVTANTNGCADALHFMEYLFGECRSFRSAGIGTKKRAANTQIKNEALGRSHINIQNRGSGVGARFHPAFDLCTLRNRGKPASRTKSVVGETRVDFCEALQRLPCGRFADDDIRIVRHNRFSIS